MGGTPGREPYTYEAFTVLVHDGDTVDFRVRLGFGVVLERQPFRLLGCNARELDQPGGSAARDHLAMLLPTDGRVVLTSTRPDKYGSRWLATVTLPDGSDLVARLVADGWAAAWSGRGTKPVPPWPR